MKNDKLFSRQNINIKAVYINRNKKLTSCEERKACQVGPSQNKFINKEPSFSKLVHWVIGVFVYSIYRKVHIQMLGSKTMILDDSNVHNSTNPSTFPMMTLDTLLKDIWALWIEANNNFGISVQHFGLLTYYDCFTQLCQHKQWWNSTQWIALIESKVHISNGVCFFM